MDAILEEKIMNRLKINIILLNVFMVLALLATSAKAERIKDMAAVDSMRENQLVGYGLVVGLNGTGDKVDQVFYTEQTLKNMMAQLGVVVPKGVKIKPKNVAAVMLHATMPAFIKKGQKIDITASSVGNSKSLRGGTLLMAPLKGADGQVYAIAQGNLIVGGLGVDGADGSSVTINLPSVGRIPKGAIVERTLPYVLGKAESFRLNLFTADFTTASRMSETINKTFGEGTAVPIDPMSVDVRAPIDRNARVAFLSMVENLTFTPGDAPARVIINSRTGTVVISSHVLVSPAAVSHGNLVVTIAESKQVSQPTAAFSDAGSTQVVQDSQVNVQEDDSRMFVFEPGIELNDIVRAVNEVGAAPGDLVAILQALKEAGALHAELIVI